MFPSVAEHPAGGPRRGRHHQCCAPDASPFVQVRAGGVSAARTYVGSSLRKRTGEVKVGAQRQKIKFEGFIYSLPPSSLPLFFLQLFFVDVELLKSVGSLLPFHFTNRSPSPPILFSKAVIILIRSVYVYLTVEKGNTAANI